jgi:hypothetical protein
MASNLFKLVTTICKKHTRALKEEADSQKYFAMIEESAPKEHRDKWEAEIREAEKNRATSIESMDIMRNRVLKVASRKDIELQIAEKELNEHGQLGQAAWISFGLDLEQEQCVIHTTLPQSLNTPI